MANWSQQARYFQRPKAERGMGGVGSFPYNNAFRSEIFLDSEPQRILFIDKGAYQSYEDPNI